MSVHLECIDCKKELPPGLERLRGYCEGCARRRCRELGEHTWDIAALGGGRALFDCLYCDATSEDGSCLEQYGFRRVDDGE